MSDLKPCPFCGGEAELWRANGERTAWVACMGRCSILVSKEHETDAEAIAAWNTRAIDPILSDPRVKALVDALTRIEEGHPAGTVQLGSREPIWRDCYRDTQRIARAALRAIWGKA